MDQKSYQRYQTLHHRQKDDSIMNTNIACTVSKRCVEKLYNQDQDELLRYFVNKFQNRSPLINRGYWLRMKVIEDVVRKFLRTESEKKFVVNLGCGSDTLPFKFLAQRPEICKNAHFVDIDYPTLMSEKCKTIAEIPKLRGIISNTDLIVQDGPGVMLTSESYTAIGCDLENTEKLNTILRDELKVEGCDVIFVAEVALTYMPIKVVDSIIEWAAGFPKSQFCFLEQHLPDGAGNPFADTMMKHFAKLQSPLKSLVQYPYLKDQKRRFIQAGWRDVYARPLWHLWSNGNFITREDRLALNDIELFDEWEEFALYSSHYILLLANTADVESEAEPVGSGGLEKVENQQANPSQTLSCSYSRHQKGEGLRRHGTSFTLGEDIVFYHGGQGSSGRVSDYFTVAPTNLEDAELPAKEESALTLEKVTSYVACHTITNLSEHDLLLVGGRASPDTPFSECFLRKDGKFTRTAHLPFGLYRHSAVAIENQVNPEKHRALIFGGKTGKSKASDAWLLWTEGEGWKNLPVVDKVPEARFGASLVVTDGTKGYLTGGMTEDGVVQEDFWEWRLVVDGDQVSIECVDLTSSLQLGDIPLQQVGRLGARLVRVPNGVMLIGGITRGGLLVRRNEILQIDPDLVVSRATFHIQHGPRPLLVGFGAELVEDQKIVITGGGGVCFSFGAFWNDGCYTLHLPGSNGISWGLKRMQDNPLAIKERTEVADALPEAKELPRMTITNANDFKGVIEENTPIILSGLDFGTCVKSWNADYLKEKIGQDRQVVVHEAKTPEMNFVEKNFSYVTRAFGDFIDDAVAAKNVYLRSVSSTKPADEATNLADDFPTIAEDFKLPESLSYVMENIHSSPLRISGSVIMWLHYDVMANVLCQIRGKKRVTLYPPADINKLNFPAGSSSSLMDPTEVESVAGVQPHIANLKPGDVLFIPAFWQHTASPLEDFSISVNVFFRNFSKGYSAGKDVYANRDFQAYETGRKDIQRIAKAFQGVSSEAGRFYLKRLAAELNDLSEKWDRRG